MTDLIPLLAGLALIAWALARAHPTAARKRKQQRRIDELLGP